GGALLRAPEGGEAGADVPEEGAAGRVGGPDLILVAEGRRRLLGPDHRGLPGGRARGSPGRRCPDVVGAGDRDGLESLERGLAGERGREVAVVQPRTVGPREMPARIRNRAEGERGVAVGDEPILEVVRQRADRAHLGLARRGAGAPGTPAVTGRPAPPGGRAGPGGGPVEWGVHARGARARR